MLAPITLFVFNRPFHTEQTLSALKQNVLADQSELIVFSDGPRSTLDIPRIEEVRSLIRKVGGFKSVTLVEGEVNRGLANSIIAGVTKVINEYGKIIVLEDDMVTSPYFLSYMNQALEMYEHEEKVISIHGYMYPVTAELPETFFIKGAECWGWATWRRGWALFDSNTLKLLTKVIFKNKIKEFNLDHSYPYATQLFCQYIGYIDSWAIRWYASAFLNDKLTLYHGESLIKNIGLDNTGVHVKSWYKEFLDTSVQSEPVVLKKIEIRESKIARKALIEYYKRTTIPLFRKILYRLKEYLGGKKM